MKIIAYFLPQFHPIPENDKWWGTGFTEWTNTKKAKPLFTGHYQPREPMDNFYYNLTDPKVRKWQSNLTKKYGIYGFCYYHYWFSGKKLLEKPLEDLLKLKDITTPFCISWANHTWNRSWTHEEKEVLQLQTYGDETEWME
ncbi:MAG: glycosyl transferase, partial [Tissierellia bacterium]|nr:glycosyl transferase [Tissierellia bacterium]